MIGDITGHAVDSFGIDLAAGRAIGSGRVRADRTGAETLAYRQPDH